MAKEFLKNNLKFYRYKKGLRQKDAAKEIGFDTHYMSSLENGRRIPRVDIALGLAKFYRCTVEDLYDKPIDSAEYKRAHNDYLFIRRSLREREKELERRKNNE